jgi:type IV pilus assembly protein PilB
MPCWSSRRWPAKANGGKLGYNLVKLGFVKDEEITALLSKQYGVPSINLAQFEIDPASSS